MERSQTNREINMNKHQCMQLIKFYGSYRLLWDANDENYGNKSARINAWKTITRKMNLPMIDLRMKMASLLGSYRREKSREKRSQKSNADPKKRYKSNWYAFNAFSFMMDRKRRLLKAKMKRLEKLANETEEERRARLAFNRLQDELKKLCETPEQRAARLEKLRLRYYASKKKPREDQSNNELTIKMEEETQNDQQHTFDTETANDHLLFDFDDQIQVENHLFDVDTREQNDPEHLIGTSRMSRKRVCLQNSTNSEEDEFDLFGRSMAYQLKRMPELTAIELMQTMQEIVFEKRKQLHANNGAGFKNPLGANQEQSQELDAGNAVETIIADYQSRDSLQENSMNIVKIEKEDGSE